MSEDSGRHADRGAHYRYYRDVPENHNPNASVLLSLKYGTMRRRMVRKHIEVGHAFDEAPPLAVPAHVDGVVP